LLLQELHRMGLYFFLEKFPFLRQDNEEETFKMGLKGWTPKKRKLGVTRDSEDEKKKI